MLLTLPGEFLDSSTRFAAGQVVVHLKAEVSHDCVTDLQAAALNQMSAAPSRTRYVQMPTHGIESMANGLEVTL